MRLGAVRPGDVVLGDRKGRRFHALVIARDGGHLEVSPLDHRISYRRLAAREVLEVWHRRRRRNEHQPGESA